MPKDDPTLIDEVLKHIPNKYLAVIVASKRAREINEGIRPLVKTRASKPTTMALEEIAQGLVLPDTERPELQAAEGKEMLPAPEETEAEEE